MNARTRQSRPGGGAEAAKFSVEAQAERGQRTRRGYRPPGSAGEGTDA